MSEKFQEKIDSYKAKQQLQSNTTDYISCVFANFLTALSEFNAEIGVNDTSNGEFVVEVDSLTKAGKITMFILKHLVKILSSCFSITIAFNTKGFLLNWLLSLLGLKTK